MNNTNFLDTITGGEPVKVQHELIMSTTTAITIFVVTVLIIVTKKIIL
jgi:hypothetical protein